MGRKISVEKNVELTGGSHIDMDSTCLLFEVILREFWYS